MPTHRQNTVEVPTTSRGNGSSDTRNLKDIFPASPIHKGELTDEVVREQGQKLLLDGIVNDEGHTFGEFDRDYSGSPDFNDVEVGGEGKPGTPFSPNIASPAVEGSLNPADIPAEGVEATERAGGGGDPFPGDTLVSPSKTSKTIASQKIGSLIFGTSNSRE